MIIHVPDMSCKHCEKILTEALVPLVGEGNVSFDLESHTITIKGSADWENIAAVIRKAGYSPNRM